VDNKFLSKEERQCLRNRVEYYISSDVCGGTFNEVLQLLDHIDALERQVEELQDIDMPDSLNVAFMHDGHWFTRLEGNTLDEILAHADEIESGEDGSYGSLCPIILLRGTKEIRRVGPMAHARGSKDPKDHWIKGKAEWKAAAEADPDVQRILKAAIASAQECETCNGSRTIIGFVNSAIGCDSQPCPDCNSASAQEGK
jgi:hypothetical protein